MIDPPECKGCMEGYDNGQGVDRIQNCIVLQWSSPSQCPCSICLVKVICNRSNSCDKIKRKIRKITSSPQYKEADR